LQWKAVENWEDLFATNVVQKTKVRIAAANHRERHAFTQNGMCKWKKHGVRYHKVVVSFHP